jgi:pentatricopeptide repeat protein
MRWMRIFVFVIPMLGVVAYRLHYRSASDVTAANLIDHSFAPSWSSNEQSISSLQAKLEREPDNARANAGLGQAYLQRARESGDPAYYTKAEILFERALKADPRLTDAILGKASLLMAQHRFGEAHHLAQEEAMANPDVVATYGILTDSLVELGRYDEAIRTLETMVRRKPNLSSYSRVSYLRELMGDTDGAIEAMKMAINSGAPHAENTAWCMVQLGNLYLNSAKPEKAAEQYQQALIRFPDYAYALAGLARVAAGRGDLETAVQEYRRAMERIPLAEFAMGLGEVYQRLSRTEDAGKQFDLVEAIQKLYQANGVSVDIEMALFNADRGRNLEQALAVAKSEWQVRKSVRVADVYAWVLYNSGRYDEAQGMMKQALRLGTRDPLFLRHAEAISRAAKPLLDRRGGA